MKKNIVLITLIVIISTICISGCIGDSDSDSSSTDMFSADYPANQGNVIPNSSDLKLKYNDAKSSTYYFKYTSGGTAKVYYDKKILEGTVKIDLNKVNWTNSHDDVDLSSMPDNAKPKSDINYAKEHFLKDIQKDFNSNLNKSCNIKFYNKNNTVVTLTDKSKKPGPVTKNITLDGDTLSVKLYKNYQVNATTKIGKSGSYAGVLVVGTQPKTHTIDHAELEIELYNSEYSYTLISKLDNKVFKLVQG